MMKLRVIVFRMRYTVLVYVLKIASSSLLLAFGMRFNVHVFFYSPRG